MDLTNTNWLKCCGSHRAMETRWSSSGSICKPKWCCLMMSVVVFNRLHWLTGATSGNSLFQWTNNRPQKCCESGPMFGKSVKWFSINMLVSVLSERTSVLWVHRCSTHQTTSIGHHQVVSCQCSVLVTSSQVSKIASCWCNLNTLTRSTTQLALTVTGLKRAVLMSAPSDEQNRYTSSLSQCLSSPSTGKVTTSFTIASRQTHSSCALWSFYGNVNSRRGML